MASLNLAGKNAGYVKLTAPDDSSNNPTVTLPTESGELALKGDTVWTEEDGKAVYDGDIKVNGLTVGRGKSNGRNNVAFGTGANESITTGTENTAIGVNALKDVTEGINNTGLGTFALFRATEGSNNTAIGVSSGDNVTTGTNNTFLGRASGGQLTTGSNNTTIGYGAQPSAPDVSNEVTIGNDDVTKTRLNGNVEIGSTPSKIFYGGVPYLFVKHGVFQSSSGLGILRAIGEGPSYSGGEVLTCGNEGNNPFNAVRFRVGMSTVDKIVGTIYCDTTSTSYNTSSDYRLKENVALMSGSIDRLKQLKPSTWTWRQDGSHGEGFLAHEAQAVVPQSVTGTKDAMRTEEYEVTPEVLDDDGNVVTSAIRETREVPDYQGIDQSKLVPLLTSALQEAITKIEDLETRIQTSYSAEEVDKKLAIKDKLIEKLEARLDKLEAKLKK